MVITVQLKLHNCSKVDKGIGAGAKDVVCLFRSIGGQFLRVIAGPRAGQRIEQVDPDPESKATATGPTAGNVIALDLSHALLQRDYNLPDPDYYRDFDPVGSVSFFQYSRDVSVSQVAPHFAGPHRDPKWLDRIAMGEWALGKLAFPVFRPSYAKIDQYGANFEIPQKAIQRVEIKHIYWANFFGPPYVKKYGEAFLLGAPAWKIEKTNGGVVVVVRESFSDWCVNKPHEILDYFKQKVPGVKHYKPVQRKY